MKKLTAIILHSSFFILHLAAVAAIPQRWTVETSRVQPAQFEAFHGETIEFAAAMQTYGKPLAITNDLIGIYWQTNGMGSAYWTAPAVLSNNVMIARWTPEMDVGANVYSCFIGAPGEIYRAAFQLRLRPSPGAVPSELPLPVKTLDFAQVQVLNQPYYTRGETDARIIELAPVADLTPATNYTDQATNDLGAALLPRIAAKQDALPYPTNAIPAAAITNAPWLTSETDPSVDDKISTHNSSTAAHADIRQSVSAKYSKPSSGIPKSDLASAVQTSLGKADTAVQPSAISDMETKTHAAATYQPKGSYLTSETDPSVDGKISDHNSNHDAHDDIREELWDIHQDIGAKADNDMVNAEFENIYANFPDRVEVDDSIDDKISAHNTSTSAHSDIRGSVTAKYSKPSSGIPKTDLASAVQTSLGKADSALQAAHNTSTTAHADIRTAAANAQAHSEATRQIVSTWEVFYDGSNVVFSITNFISGAYSLDHAKLQIKELLPGADEYRIVYDSRTEITNHTEAAKREMFGVVNSTAAVLRAEIAAKGDKAWGRRSSTGQEVPISNTVWVTEQNLRIAGGMEYERVAVGEGAIYVLTSKGQAPYMTGDEGALMLKDDGGTNYFGMVRSDSYTIGCDVGSIRVENDLLYLDFSVTMSDHPCIWYTESIGGDVEWEQLNLPDGSAVPGASHVVVWDESPRLGAQECYINCENKPGGFFRATIEVAGDARFRTNMPAEIPSFYCADDPTKKVKIIWNNGNPKFVEAN